MNPSNLLPCLLAVAGFIFDLAAYYPGQMTFDSAYAWWQARGGESSDTQSPMLVHVWRFGEAFLPGPGLIFGLHLLLFWVGLSLIALGLRLRPLASVLLMLLVGFAPISTFLRAHVWTDVGMVGALLVVTGALTVFVRTAHRRWLLLALPLGFCALSLRHNALPALLPLVVYAVQQFLASGGTPHSWIRTGAATGLVLAMLFGAVQAINSNVDRHAPMWPVIAEFDLAALSIATNQVLLPGFVVGDGMDVPDLKQAFRPWGIDELLSSTQHGIRAPLALPGWTNEERAGLFRAWVAASVAHPYEYIAHRLRLSAALFGTRPRELPLELTFYDGVVQYRDNPPVASNTSALHRWLMQIAEMLRGTPAFAAWPYLAAGLLVGPFAWRKRNQPAAGIALILLVSAVLYAVPLIFVAPAAELRYMLWPCVAALIAIVLVFARAGDKQSRHWPGFRRQDASSDNLSNRFVKGPAQ